MARIRAVTLDGRLCRAYSLMPLYPATLAGLCRRTSPRWPAWSRRHSPGAVVSDGRPGASGTRHCQPMPRIGTSRVVMPGGTRLAPAAPATLVGLRAALPGVHAPPWSRHVGTSNGLNGPANFPFPGKQAPASQDIPVGRVIALCEIRKEESNTVSVTYVLSYLTPTEPRSVEVSSWILCGLGFLWGASYLTDSGDSLCWCKRCLVTRMNGFYGIYRSKVPFSHLKWMMLDPYE
ncbi:hypothetical protein Bca52824_061702 [Brassica carinata]|uniref:Uncharacterized protein n=1 Tax=Brassica carinata TaxID=52824 RepID=A0A8X7R0D2_BRACI|nr:hypothetical protein Bca52824_061702 [Brassica carinata]